MPFSLLEQTKKNKMTEISQTQMNKLLRNPEIQVKVFNAFKEWLRSTEDLRKRGLTFYKKIRGNKNNSGIIFVPRRFAGKTFRILLIPDEEGHDEYETYNPTSTEEEQIKEEKKKANEERKKLLS
jgi:hypothetical protein